jgi:hypothetical protein
MTDKKEIKTSHFNGIIEVIEYNNKISSEITKYGNELLSKLNIGELLIFYNGLLSSLKFEVVHNLADVGPVTTIKEVLAFKIISNFIFDLISSKLRKHLDLKSEEYSFGTNSPIDESGMAYVQKNNYIIVNGNGKEAHDFLRKAIESIQKYES